ncbi:SDR family oxidoreductase [Mesorhizobium sp. B2-1-8]|uniref:SDR family oxidoreductase n=1 Tax=unclassified Mesorhizobium TaxID=325217 RepID=UPI00112E2019|nr:MULTISPECIES: SDR family oxidoreductase [unclassified Mesorhizobium]MBZ9668537.1 SDR family oxidoreductase [Mesorhizobium sp. ES1-3]TPI35170.1 SDR family oxidoreductase [Mesorhizobium sp. B3-2-1]UCI18998.1 SDR family oxidoreductase [Mesorhizobium sp. B2-1-8]
MAERLSGKRIFLTGAAQGIGLAIAEACLAEGAKLFLVDQDGALLDETVAGLAGPQGRVGHIAADISDGAAIAAAVRHAAVEIGPINALINNAGMNVFSTPLDATEAEWNRNFDVNVKGAWNCGKAVLPGMIASGGGAILNIASTHSFTIIPHTFPYPVAKHALLGLTKALALEYAGQGVRVNALAPGYVETQKVVDYWNSFPDPVAARAKTMALHPSGRIASPREIALAAIFMISDECPFMNAACLVVDGGLSQLQHPA